MAEQKPRRINGIRVLGILVILVTIASGVQAYVQGQATQRIANCTKAYSDGFADAIEERSAASADAQNALDDLMFAIAKATPTADRQAAARRAFDTYIAKRAEAKKTQAEHPFPAPPRDVCG